MSVNRPQTISAALAILTLFAAAAWGQQKGADIPVYESKNAIFGSSSTSGEDRFLKAALEEEIVLPFAETPSIPDFPNSPSIERLENRRARESRTSTQQTPELAPNQQGKQDPNRTPDMRRANAEIDSLFGRTSESFVDKDGYFIASAGGGLWSDFKQPSSPRVAMRPQLNASQSPASKAAGAADSAIKSVVDGGTGSQFESVVDGSIESNTASGSVDLASPTADAFATQQPVQYGQSKLRLRIGFDALLFQRGRPEDTVFASDDTGQEWSFGDFDFSDGDARYFVQFMGDDMSGFEFTFFDFNSFASTIEASGENVVPFFFQGNPVDTSTDYDLVYTSRLKNIELNSWLRHNAVQRSGYGLRHINLDESFNVLNGGNITNGLFSRTDNDLWGLTRMWERRRSLLNRVTLIGGVDAGLYLNRVKIDVDTLNIDDSSEEKNLAGSLGFNLGLEYQVAEQVTLKFGYEGLGLFGVGLASTQSLEQDVFNGLGEPELGSVYFGGFHIGAMATF
ncbi:hypothetical protein [Mariniblastus fucicola]|uniref:Outer membrane protein beta-barrel domain-containing protein n=1 Tax=Mariniblastus fucicola TaxID=980251 RepID=A0A5B9P926_9BACT|nr:hypothetical protein [Mariniblastus fucicola]QEG22864.1 hypothetical protein MFFC18_27510 [Mariniblastus fucicola]